MIWLLLASTLTALAVSSTCQVTVHTELKSGTRTNQVFRIPAESESQCKKIGDQHRTHFAQHVILKKEVSTTWLKK